MRHCADGRFGGGAAIADRTHPHTPGRRTVLALGALAAVLVAVATSVLLLSPGSTNDEITVGDRHSVTVRASEFCPVYDQLTFSVGPYMLLLGIDSKPPESWFEGPMDGVVVVESVEEVESDETPMSELFVRGRVETPLGTEQVSGIAYQPSQGAIELSCV